MARKKIISLAMAALLTVSSLWDVSPTFYEGIIANAKTASQSEEEEVVADAEAVDGNNYGLRDNIQDGTILHCFDWKYSQIKEELPNIAAAGFTSVQTSPAQKGDGDIWYWLYQPQTFSVQPNALGTKTELQALCDEAENYGIKVIVDVVANHTRNIGDDGLGADCYHNDGDAWYTNRYGITHGRIGMPDLNSESSTVQNKVKGYIEELKGIGVDGIRWDAAKHISLPSEQCQFWPVVTSVGLYNYGEILVGPLESGGEDLMKEYTNYMSVTDSIYGKNVREAFENGGVPGSIGNWSERGVAKNKLVYWGESHDTYSNNGEYGEATQFMDQNKIDRAYAIVAGQGKATSLYFSRPYQTNKQSIKAGEKGSTHFTAKEIAAVNHLHNNCVGEKDYYVNGGSAAAVCRETGAVIVKGSGSGDVTIANGDGKTGTTAPGTYKDEISGSTWTVTASTMSGSVGDSGIAVIYKDSGNGGGGGTTPTKAPTTTTKAPTTTTKAPSSGDTTAVEANTIVATKPSGWDDLYIYAYEEPDTEKSGAWPGTKLTADSDGKYRFTMNSSVTKAKVIFNAGVGKAQDPANVLGQSCGFDYVGGKAYSYDGGKWSELAIATAAPKETPTPTPKVTKAPEKETEAPKETEPPKDEEPTATPKVTKEPTPTPSDANKDSNVTVSVKDGTSFKDETLKVKLTLKGVSEGTYSVDNGPEKSFKSGDEVILGQGKIADTDVTLKVTADGKESTFTYYKEFDVNTTLVKSSAIARIQSIFEVVADAVQNDAAPGSSYYATNPSGNVGSKKTITSASDFTADMLIAQGVANDDPGAFKGTHEAPKFDPYALYGAWDDENLYVGIQYTNVIDVVDPAQQAPQTGRGKPYGADADIPQMLVFDTRSGDYTDGSTNDATQTTAWDTNIKFDGDAKVDKVFLYSPKDGIINQAFFPVSNGVVDYDNVVKSGYNKPPIPGVETTWEDGFFCSSMNGIKGTGYTGYKPADLESDSGDWVDFLAEGHSTEQDSFCIVKLPLSLLGVTASDIESNGIGVMAIATYGSSGIGSLPADMTMLDVATESYSKDDSTSQEKEDEDLVTVGLAQLGKSNGTTVTKPSKTKEPEVTEAPDETEPPKDDVATPTPKDDDDDKKVTEEPKKTEEPTEIEGPTETKVPSDVSDVYTVNFGADRSSPQLEGTMLTLKAVGYGSSDYKYEFAVDGKKVQISSGKDTCKWKAKEGTHTIKVTVEDASGKTITCEKEYVVETTGNTSVDTDAKETNPPATPTAKPTQKPTKVTEEPEVTKVPDTDTNVEGNKETPKPDDSKNTSTSTLKAKLSVKYAAPRKAGTVVPLTITAEGGAVPYIRYEIKVQLGNGKKTTILSNSKKKTVNWKPAKAGTYKIIATVTDNDGISDDYVATYVISSPVSVKTFKLSKTSIKVKKQLKITAKGTSTSSVKYQFKVQKVGAKNASVIRKYSKKATATWKAKKKGKYYVILQVKDANGNIKTSKKKVTVK